MSQISHRSSFLFVCFYFLWRGWGNSKSYRKGVYGSKGVRSYSFSIILQYTRPKCTVTTQRVLRDGPWFCIHEINETKKKKKKLLKGYGSLFFYRLEKCIHFYMQVSDSHSIFFIHNFFKSLR